MNRLPALNELLEDVLSQDYAPLEIIVVEQSTNGLPQDLDKLNRLEQDPRLTILRTHPQGGARARNIGVRTARGEVVLLIDDDDRPEGPHWVSAHMRNYEDPNCLGVTGRHKLHGDDDRCPYPWKRMAYRRCQAFSRLLKLPQTYVRQTQRKVPVDSIHGTNGSVRRSVIDRFGGWDEDTRIEDEASFAYRAQKLKKTSEYFAFDPLPVVVRGLDIPGGLNKRYMSASAFAERFMDFVHVIVARYFPLRVLLLYPLYVAAGAFWTCSWIWTDSQRHAQLYQKIAATASLPFILPSQAIRGLMRVLRAKPKDNDRGSHLHIAHPPPQNNAP